MFPTTFLEEREKEIRICDRRDQETKAVTQRVNRRCSSKSRSLIRHPASEDPLVQRLVLLAKGIQDQDSEVPVVASIQNTVNAWMELARAETDETLRKYEEAVRDLEKMMDKMFELSYNADVNLSEFEHTLLEQWRALKLMCEHTGMQRGALTGMSYVLRFVLKCHEAEDLRQKQSDVPDTDPSDDVAVQGKVAVVEQMPMEAQTDLLCLPQDRPAYIDPVSFKVGADSSVDSTPLQTTWHRPVPLHQQAVAEAHPDVPKGRSAHSKSVAEPTLAVAAQMVEAEPALLKGLSLDAEYAAQAHPDVPKGRSAHSKSVAEPTLAVAAQMVEATPSAPKKLAGATGDSVAKRDVELLMLNHSSSQRTADVCKVCNDENGLCSKESNGASCQLSSKGKREGSASRERRQREEERPGWRSCEVPSAATGSGISSNSIAGDYDSDTPEDVDVEFLLRNHPGSQRHPDGCKACHFQGGLCWKGLKCNFCHICPKPKRKSKHQRDVDRRRQERYLQLQLQLGGDCCEMLAMIDERRRWMMSYSEELKKQVKDAYESQDRESIEQVNRIVDRMWRSVTDLAGNEEG